MFYIVKDGKIEAQTGTRENALDLIRAYQEKETHFLLRANFSIIEGIEEHIKYSSNTK